MFSLFKRKPSEAVARRLLAVATAHGIQQQEIPRLFPEIGYAQLDDLQALAQALTPAIVDSVAQLFGVRREYLEGLDALMYVPFGSGRARARDSTRELVDAIARATLAWPDQAAIWRGPLVVLTADLAPDRCSGRKQRLVPVIVETSGAELDGPVYRCRVFGGYFDWNDPDQRIGLKALAWLVWKRLRRVVPLYQVAESELIDVMSGTGVPSVALLRTVVTNPSLEDYVEEPGSSAVARESEELPAVIGFLNSSGLMTYWDVATARRPREADTTACVDTAAPQQQTTCQPDKPRGGKREVSEALKDELRAVARGIWDGEPRATITHVVRRLKAMPHLKGSAWSESAIHKAIRNAAPSNKPGRRPKQSA